MVRNLEILSQILYFCWKCTKFVQKFSVILTILLPFFLYLYGKFGKIWEIGIKSGCCHDFILISSCFFDFFLKFIFFPIFPNFSTYLICSNCFRFFYFPPNLSWILSEFFAINNPGFSIETPIHYTFFNTCDQESSIKLFSGCFKSISIHRMIQNGGKGHRLGQNFENCHQQHWPIALCRS